MPSVILCWFRNLTHVVGTFPQYFTPSFINSISTFIKHLLCVGLMFWKCVQPQKRPTDLSVADWKWQENQRMCNNLPEVLPEKREGAVGRPGPSFSADFHQPCKLESRSHCMDAF